MAEQKVETFEAEHSHMFKSDWKVAPASYSEVFFCLCLQSCHVSGGTFSSWGPDSCGKLLNVNYWECVAGKRQGPSLEKFENFRVTSICQTTAVNFIAFIASFLQTLYTSAPVPLHYRALIVTVQNSLNKYCNGMEKM